MRIRLMFNALVTLGPELLATLLAETAVTNPSMRRRLQFELSARNNENMPEAVRRWIVSANLGAPRIGS